MNRPSISLHLIVKNERHNLPPLFESVKDCFDEIHVTDTGSVDGTLELLEEYTKENPANSKVFVHHFKWCDDFSAARNASFEPGKCEYKMWLDADDALLNREAFISWRDNAMGLSDYWLAVYHYGFAADKKTPIVSFIRERAVKWSMGFKWRDFVHEGINPAGMDVKMNHISTWSVKHRRSESDLAQDRSRNLALFEKNKDKMNPRLRYYYGKELFEAGQIFDAVKVLIDAVSDPQMEIHDRTLGIQYAAYGLLGLSQFEKAIQLAHQGLQLAPERAEFWVCIGDAYVKMGAAQRAIPMYKAAASCGFHDPSQPGWGAAIFSAKTCYTDYPNMQLGRIYAQMGDYPNAMIHFQKAFDFGAPDAGKALEATKDEMRKNAPNVHTSAKKSEDIVISCHPAANLYEWDEDVIKTRGIGGSETAAVHMAHHLAKLTGRRVKVFNFRTQSKTFGDVEYISNGEVVNYFSQFDPKLHISWRHTVKKGSNQVVWCHDLITPNIDKIDARIAVLSPFHANYAHAMQGVDKSKMFLTRNGIDPKRFAGVMIQKTPTPKVIFSSSPDRGLEHCIKIMELVREKEPKAELHAFYGFENMRKFGMGKQADHLESMMKEREWVKFHGNVTQAELAQAFASSDVWLYPADFIETFCITALEARLLGCRGVGRNIGALPYTMGQFKENILLDVHPKGNESAYAEAVISQLKQKQPELLDLTPYSWETVAKEWIEEFKL